MSDWTLVNEDLPGEDEEVFCVDWYGNLLIGHLEKSHDKSITGFTCYADECWLDDILAWTAPPYVDVNDLIDRYNHIEGFNAFFDEHKE